MALRQLHQLGIQDVREVLGEAKSIMTILPSTILHMRIVSRRSRRFQTCFRKVVYSCWRFERDLNFTSAIDTALLLSRRMLFNLVVASMHNTFVRR